VAEVFGDEVVIVNLDSGIYYSLRNTAAQIWIRLQNQYSPDEILNDLNIMYSQNETGIQKDLENFINRLITEKLVTETAENDHQPLPAPVPNGKPVFKTPVVEIYSDMQDILLLDPVHDVDKAGWPITKDQGNS